MTTLSRSTAFRFKLALLALVAVVGLAFAATAEASDPAEYGIKSFNASLSTTQAGAHADFTTELELKTDPDGLTENGLKPPYARTRDISISVPPGLIGNPSNFPECTTLQLNTGGGNCPQDSQIGITEISVYKLSTFTEPVFLMKPPAGGDVVARIGFIAAQWATVLDIRLRPEENYGLEARLEGANALARLVTANTTLWGVPTASVHDPQRRTPGEVYKGESPPGGGRASGLAPTAFMTNPTHCGVERQLTATTDSYQLPGQFSTATASLPAITGCGKLTFPPRLSLTPTSTLADSPSGIDAELSLAQEGLREPGVLATPHLKRSVVSLPRGMSLNAAAASGLGACTEAQIGLVSESPIRFNGADPTCPLASKVGTAEITTPVLPAPIQGSLYLASQSDNPFHALLAGYLVAQGQGVTLKVAGRFEVDSASGQITAVFDENPEQPFEDLRLHFKAGANGVLTTPNACGTYSIDSTLSPWSAADPANPTPTEVVNSSSLFPIDVGPNGGPCPNGAFSPALSAGTTNPIAGSYSPFQLRLTRDDGTQRLAGLELTLPPGLTGKLAGIPYCPDAALRAAASLNALGQGATELGSPSCPAASQLGTVTAGAGSGPSPFFVSTGKAYLAGPYEGAPISMAIVTPAVAGPFDLGNVVVRAALKIDPSTARVTAVSDPLPTTLFGIPLDLRDVRVSIDRSGFTLNPTSCEPKAFSGVAVGQEGARAPISERFQAASCASLTFKPKLSLRLEGGTKRGGHPALRAVLTMPPGGANLARAQVALPHSEFLDQSHIGTVCTRVQFAADQCPARSVYGHVTATSPLVDYAVQGPVYLRSSSHKLPDLVMALHGPPSQPVEVDAVARIDSVNGGIRSSFEATPDLPLSKVVLSMNGAKQGLLENSTNLCARTNRAEAKFGGQNGKALVLRPALQNSCPKAQRKRTTKR